MSNQQTHSRTINTKDTKKYNIIKIKKTKKNNPNSITILHWNCFTLSESRFIELSLFISDLQEDGTQPDIISLNETKINNELANHRLNLKGYCTIHKGRSKNPLQGGGIALLIKDSIPFTQNSKLARLFPDLEFLCITIGTKSNKNINILSYYNPPNSELNKNLFDSLKTERLDFILVGDLNSKSPLFDAKNRNKNGLILENIIDENNLIVMKNQEPTYKKFNSDYKEILDLVICTPALIPLMDKITVFDDQSMGSDHFPMLVKYHIDPDSDNSIKKKTTNLNFNFAKADWNKFKENLSTKNIDNPENLDLDFLAKFVSDSILDSANECIPKKSPKPFKSCFPAELVSLILERKSARLRAHKTGLKEDKAAFNKLTLKIRVEKIKLKSKEWEDFLLMQGPNLASSKPFWKKVNKVLKGTQSQKIPKLFFEGQNYSSDSEKAEIFMQILSQTFSGSNFTSNSNSTQLEVDLISNEFLSNRRNLIFEKVNITELKAALKGAPHLLLSRFRSS